MRAIDPTVGQTLRFEGREWEITDHSSYWDAGEHRVNEWSCESGDVTAYLLKEVSDSEGTRWFFTRLIPSDQVTLAGGQGLQTLIGRGGEPGPPDELVHQQQTFRHAETTDGTYEDEPGERVRKVTWEFWDARHETNLAVELWGDGRFDCYRGAYIEPDQVTLGGSPGGDPPGGVSASPGLVQRLAGQAAGQPAARTSPANPFVLMAVLLPVVYACLFFAGRPFDAAMLVALPTTAALGWLRGLFRAPLAAWVSLLGAGALACVFWVWRIPPLTSADGLAALVAAPAAVGWVARVRGGAHERRVVQYLGGFAVAAPLLALGLYHYVQFAPDPRSLQHWVLALGPAAVAGLAGMVVATLMLAGARGDAR